MALGSLLGYLGCFSQTTHFFDLPKFEPVVFPECLLLPGSIWRRNDEGTSTIFGRKVFPMPGKRSHSKSNIRGKYIPEFRCL